VSSSLTLTLTLTLLTFPQNSCCPTLDWPFSWVIATFNGSLEACKTIWAIKLNTEYRAEYSYTHSHSLTRSTLTTRSAKFTQLCVSLLTLFFTIFFCSFRKYMSLTFQLNKWQEQEAEEEEKHKKRISKHFFNYFPLSICYYCCVLLCMRIVYNNWIAIPLIDRKCSAIHVT